MTLEALASLLPERITRRIAEAETGCWEWRGYHTSSGYGQACWKGRLISTHRLVFSVFNGEIPQGLQIDHLCRNRGCCNPQHLEAVTPAENVRRGLSGVLRARTMTHCVKGHLYSTENVSVDKRGRRQCKACGANRYAESRARNLASGLTGRGRVRRRALSHSKMNPDEIRQTAASRDAALRAPPPRQKG